MENRHILILVLTPILIGGGYFFFKKNLQLTFIPPKKENFIDEKTVFKYNKIEKLLKTNKEINTTILNKILKITKNNKRKIIKKTKHLIIPLNLRYIIITNKKRVAFINNKMVTINSKIYDFKVINITNKCVYLKSRKDRKCICLK